MALKERALPKNGPKDTIIEFILENDEAVKGSQIREHLKKKNPKVDQGNVNRDLHELQGDYECIQFETGKIGRRKYNLWNKQRLNI